MVRVTWAGSWPRARTGLHAKALPEQRAQCCVSHLPTWCNYQEERAPLLPERAECWAGGDVSLSSPCDSAQPWLVPAGSGHSTARLLVLCLGPLWLAEEFPPRREAGTGERPLGRPSCTHGRVLEAAPVSVLPSPSQAPLGRDGCPGLLALSHKEASGLMLITDLRAQPWGPVERCPPAHSGQHRGRGLCWPCLHA